MGCPCRMNNDIKSQEWNWKHEGLMIEDAVSPAEQQRWQQQLAVPTAPAELVGPELDAVAEEHGSTRRGWLK